MLNNTLSTAARRPWDQQWVSPLWGCSQLRTCTTILGKRNQHVQVEMRVFEDAFLLRDAANVNNEKGWQEVSIKSALARCVSVPMIAWRGPGPAALHPLPRHSGQMATSEWDWHSVLNWFHANSPERRTARALCWESGLQNSQLKRKVVKSWPDKVKIKSVIVY